MERQLDRGKNGKGEGDYICFKGTGPFFRFLGAPMILYCKSVFLAVNASLLGLKVHKIEIFLASILKFVLFLC